MKTLTKFVIFSISVLLIYTIAALLISVHFPNSNFDTVTTCFFTFFGTEIGSCAVIRIFKNLNIGGKNDADNFDTATDLQPDDGTGDGSAEEDHTIAG